jgi:hypothetical protein
MPPEQASVVQTMPSSGVSPSSATCAHPFGLAQLSTVHGFPSSHETLEPPVQNPEAHV